MVEITGAGIVSLLRAEHACIVVGTVLHGERELEFSSRADEVTARTAFEIGSLGKTFTSLLLAVLHTTGRLDQETTLDTILGSESGRFASTTLIDLALHRSGLPRLPAKVAACGDPHDPYARLTRDDVIAELGTCDNGAPAYSNLGYQLLGVCIERAVGADLDALMTEAVFAPLNMLDTAPSGRQQPDLRGYALGRQVSRWHSTVNGDGGWESTPADMLHYLAALVHPDGHSLAPAMAHVREPQINSPVYNCLGWAAVGDYLGHDGGTSGFSAALGFSAEQASGAFILANTAELSVNDVLFGLLEDLEPGE